MVRWLSGNTRPGCERTFMFLKSQKRRYEYSDIVQYICDIAHYICDTVQYICDIVQYICDIAHYICDTVQFL